MLIHTIGTRFTDYQQYCDLVDEALAAFHAPLMNGLPLASDARRLIECRRLFYVKNPDHLLIFSAHTGYYKLYYAAQEEAVLIIPDTKWPIVADQVRLTTKRYPKCDALMARSRFSLGRVDVRMERKLDEELKLGQYVHTGMPKHSRVGYALTGEYYKINTLLRKVFDPLLDELPCRDDLIQSICDGHVLVVRDHERIAAVMVYIAKGSVAMLHWIAVAAPYRNMRLSGLLHFTGDRVYRERGFYQVVLWVDETSEAWIRAVEERGYQITKQRLYTYVHKP